ncbi:MAG: phage minor tail protein L [Aquabacterium sp.]
MPANIAIQLAALSHDAVIELFELDLTALGGAVQRWHNGTNALNAAVVWQGNTYPYWPIEAAGFATRSSGPLPRPTLRVANVGGVVGVLARQYNGLKGALLRRKRTLARYLDAANFPGGVNASADPTTFYPDELWVVDRQAQRDRRVAAFELVSPIDLPTTELPRRPVLANSCWWIQDGGYRGANCGYTGPAVAKADDTPTSDMAQDRCGGRLASCRLRQWPGNELAYGGFPGVGVLRNG